ncbi:SMC-Scp complex subunit ScpB [Pseudoalteromonas marina]|jgi:segregation and condensation protein B|uniref:SMC-Scp complex subunit ScpB n=1 Tax=Pseudoalteromonas marina TaxID=267375 RepID=A0ABT9FIG7_9GAMM|nr:SMC-Scp complex subunit ScpB [Pseudoalteromonas marina]MDP2566405.1 SMC-Scp complex subunit ScpB [Pseudoalteromonas marina]
MSDELNFQHIKKVTEAAIFANGSPITIPKMLETVFSDYDVKKRDVKKALLAIEEEYADKGINLIQLADGYTFETARDINHQLACLWEESPPKYSRALLETLALIAYKQPITRPQIEDIRGVSVSHTIMKTLKERQWIKAVGHMEVPGRPTLYGTTNEFLNYMRIKSLNQLPELPELKEDKHLGLINADDHLKNTDADKQMQLDNIDEEGLEK